MPFTERIGEWRAYVPERQFNAVAQSATKIYAGAESSLLIIDKIEWAPRRLTKVEGLSDVGIQYLEYSDALDALVIVYRNANIDIVQGGVIYNLADIERKADIAVKEVNDVHLEGDILYMATTFGIVAVDIQQREVRFTTFTDIDISSVLAQGDEVLVGTGEGIYSKDVSVGNPTDFLEWDFVNDQVAALPADFTVTALARAGATTYIGTPGEVWAWQGNTVTTAVATAGFTPTYLVAGADDEVFVGWLCDDEGCDGKVDLLGSDGSVTTLNDFCVDRPLDAMREGNGRIWLADRFEGLRLTDDSGGCTPFEFGGPFSNTIYSLTYGGGRLWASSGGPTLQFGFQATRLGSYAYDGEDWSYINERFTPALSGTNHLFNHSDVAIHPVDSTVYIASYYGGLIALDDGEVTLYDDANSGLPADGEQVRLISLDFDSQHNLWMVLYRSTNNVVVLTNEGEWLTFTASGIFPQDLVVDNFDNLWIASNAGVTVFSAGDLATTTDDRQRRFVVSEQGLPSNDIRSLAVDLDNQVWVGTVQGVAYFPCGSSPFDAQFCGAQRVTVEEGGENDYLLQNETVEAITIDGADRKWFGTTNGLFVQSPSARTRIDYFSTDNSPLFSNEITALATDGRSGTVYIGTSKGLVSYRSDATEGDEFQHSGVYAFPNPVRPEYDGPIAITGLARDSDVKIADVNGRIVYETTANGGQAIWDGRDYNGQEVASGVYLVLGTTTPTLTTPNTVVTKVMIVR